MALSQKYEARLQQKWREWRLGVPRTRNGRHVEVL